MNDRHLNAFRGRGEVMELVVALTVVVVDVAVVVVEGRSVTAMVCGTDGLLSVGGTIAVGRPKTWVPKTINR